MNERLLQPASVSRRRLLQTASAGFGYLALAELANRRAAAESPTPLEPRPTHFPPRAKRVVFLCMSGGPSHVDTFDYKPQLQTDDGKSGAASRGGRARLGRLLGSPWQFSQHGQSGLWISELFPEVAKHADQLCLIRSMHTDQPAHPQAMLALHTGSSRFTRPSLGAWTLYGLGSENDSLPGYISLNPVRGSTNYGSAFLPAIYQGTPIAAVGAAEPKLDHIANVRYSSQQQRLQLDFGRRLNEAKAARDGNDDAIEAVIAAHELAFRMQDIAPEVMDIDRETAATRNAYGVDQPATSAFARQCLVARRLLQAGVRFVEIGHNGWDQHTQLRERHASQAKAVDQPIAALLADLKQQGLLQDTLVIWGGEFGRTPTAQGNDGRDHNNKGYTMWMAGGGVKGGFSYGMTDEYGAEAVEDKVHTHDFHATILHVLGLDHKRLTYRYAGRDFRLTDVYGEVVDGILS